MQAWNSRTSLRRRRSRTARLCARACGVEAAARRAAARAAGDPALPAVADPAGVPCAVEPDEAVEPEPPPDLDELIGDTDNDGVFTEGVCTLGTEGVLTLGTDGVLTCGTDGVGTLGTDGVGTLGTEGVLTCGTWGTGTDESGVCGSCTWVWSCRTQPSFSVLESTPCAEPAMGTTAATTAVTGTAMRRLLSLAPVKSVPPG